MGVWGIYLLCGGGRYAAGASVRGSSAFGLLKHQSELARSKNTIM